MAYPVDEYGEAGDFISFGTDLVLTGTSPTGALYCVTKADGLAGLPRPRIVMSKLAGVPGAVLSEIEDDERTVGLTGEIKTNDREIMMREIARFKYLLSVRRGEQWLYWKPEGQVKRRIKAILQNDAGAGLALQETVDYYIKLLCADPYWRSVSDIVDAKSLNATGQSIDLHNPGNVFSEPVIKLEPTNAKVGGFGFKRWIPLWNRSGYALSSYPIEVTAHTTVGLEVSSLIGGGKLQEDHDDLRVEVDGSQVDRWLGYTVIEDCEDVWNEFVDPDFTIALDAVDYKVGANSNEFTIAAAAAAGDMVTEVVGPLDLSGYKKISLWIKSSVNTALGDFQILLDDNANCASPVETLNVPALVAGTWTCVELTLAAPASCTAIISVGFKYTVDVGACVVHIDDLRSFTKVWANFNYQIGVETTMDEAFLAGAAISSLTLADTSSLPSSGTVYNADTDEAFVYTAKDDGLNKLTGVTRAAKGTTAANATIGDEVRWIAHDIWLLYGNSTIGVPTQDDNYEPAFELDLSTNKVWVYEEFGEDDGLRTGGWTRHVITGFVLWYGGNHNGVADPWVDASMFVEWPGEGRYRLYNPCGITNINLSNGENFATVKTDWEGDIESSPDGSSWTVEYTIPDPALDATWDPWSFSGAITSGAKYVSMRCAPPTQNNRVEVADATITLNIPTTPAITMGVEQGAYTLDVTLTLVVDAVDQEMLHLTMTMGLNEELEIDCEIRTVTYLEDESNQFQALELLNPTGRAYWLRLPGHWDGGKACSIRVDETGLAGMDITVTYPGRWL